MRKFFFLVGLVWSQVGCAQKYVSVVNLCSDSVAVITDGQGGVRASLYFGARTTVELSGESGRFNRLVLTADFRRPSTGEFMGTRSKDFYVYSSSATGVQETTWDLQCP